MVPQSGALRTIDRLESPGVPFPANDVRAVSVCWVDATALAPSQAAEWLPRLPDNERVRYGRYRKPIDAHQFLVGRLLVRRWMSRLALPARVRPEAWRLTDGERGRPSVADPKTDWTFNLAHSGGLVACAMAHRSHIGDVGVDLEDMDRRTLVDDLARRFCAPSERLDIERHAGLERTRRFLTYWTLKEAYLKARGLGIAVHLADIAFELDGAHPTITFRESLTGTNTAWAFELFHPTSRYVLSVAVPLADGRRRPPVTVRPLTLAELMAS